MSQICEHPEDTFTQKHSKRNLCPTCVSHICLRCRALDAGSWLGGYCDGCYRINEREAKAQQAIWDAEAKRQERERIWREGWDHYRIHFSPNDPEYGKNPYEATQ